LIYIEVKSSAPRNIEQRQIGAFVERVAALAPDMAVLLKDTQLRMLDKLIPALRAELGRHHWDAGPYGASTGRSSAAPTDCSSPTASRTSSATWGRAWLGSSARAGWRTTRGAQAAGRLQREAPFPRLGEWTGSRWGNHTCGVSRACAISSS
jgi:hypothetical protein